MRALLEATQVSAFAPIVVWLVLDATLKSVLILVLAGVAVRWLRSASAATRHLVLFVAVASLLVLPLLSAILPAWNIVPNWTEQARSRKAFESALTEQSIHVPQLSSPGGASFLQDSPVSSPGLSEVQRPAATTLDQSLSVGRSTPPITKARRFDFSSYALIAWVAGTFLALMPTVLGVASLWHLGRVARRVTEGTWLDLLQRLTVCLSFKRPVALLKSSQRRMPMTWGLFRPKLLLPDEADDWNDERRRVVLLHELAHVKRWDYLTNLITQITCALYWFNPLVWIAARRMVTERERACDDLVLNQGAKPANYAEHVLQLASGLQSNPFEAYNGVAMARPSKLEGRLRAILDRNRNRAGLTMLAILAALGLAATLVVPVAMLNGATPRDPVKLNAEGILRTPNSDQSPVTPAASDWGEAVEGFRTRLRAEKKVWRLGEAPVLLVDFHNSGRRRLGSTTNDYLWQIEVNGVWHRGVAMNGELLEITPSQPLINVPLLLNALWFTARSSELSAAIYGGGGTWVPRPPPLNDTSRLTLAPGKHTLRFAAFGVPMLAGNGEPVRALSNPIEIEITGADPGKVEPVWPPSQSIVMTGKVMDAESRQPIENFTIKTGGPGDPDYMYWHTRMSFQGHSGPYRIELQPSQVRNFLKIESPGYMPETIKLDGANTNQMTWNFALRKGDGFNGKVFGSDGRPVEGAQVTFRFIFGGSTLSGRKLLRHTSDSDYMSQRSASPDIQFPTNSFPEYWHRNLIETTDAQGRFKVRALPGARSLIVLHEKGFAEVHRDQIEKTMTIRLQPWERNAEVAAAQGFQVSLRADRTTWESSETPSLRADIRDLGPGSFRSSTNSHLWRLEVDGHRYNLYHGDQSGALHPIEPNQQWTNRPVILNTKWNTVHPDQLSSIMYGVAGPWNPRWNPGSVPFAPLRLSLGKHTIRLSVFAAGPTGTIRATSNPLEIEIAPERGF